MAYNLLSGTVVASQKYLPGDLIVENLVSGSFKGDGSDIEYVPRVSNATNNGIITNVGGDANTLTCESNLTFDGSLLNITGDLTASVGISASYFIGDGSGLTGISGGGGSASGSARLYSATGVETSGYLKVTGSVTLAGSVSSSAAGAFVGSVSSSGDVAVTGSVHAALYFGDGSNLTGISAGNVSGSARVYTITGFETSGFLKVTGSAYLSGGVAYNRRTLSAVTTASSADYFLGLDSSAGAFAIELADAAAMTNGQTVVLKDEGGVANTNNITVYASASQTIDGQNSIVLESPHASIQLYCNGVDKYYIY
jgi:hypothetical protein